MGFQQFVFFPRICVNLVVALFVVDLPVWSSAESRSVSVSSEDDLPVHNHDMWRSGRRNASHVNPGKINETAKGSYCVKYLYLLIKKLQWFSLLSLENHIVSNEHGSHTGAKLHVVQDTKFCVLTLVIVIGNLNYSCNDASNKNIALKKVHVLYMTNVIDCFGNKCPICNWCASTFW